MKIVSVLLYVFIAHFVSATHPSPTNSNISCLDESQEDANQTNTSADHNITQSRRERNNSSKTSENIIPKQLHLVEICEESLELDSLKGRGRRRAESRSPTCRYLPYPFPGNRTKRRSSYTRVLLGTNCTGSDIYVSSPTLKRSASLAESFLQVYISPSPNLKEISLVPSSLSGLERPGPSGLRVQSDAQAFEDFCSETSSCRSTPQDLSESPHFTSAQKCPPRLTRIESELVIDATLIDFVSASNTLLNMLEEWDQNFGSARRLRNTLSMRAQDAFSLLERLLENLLKMRIFDHPAINALLDRNIQSRLIDVTESIIVLNEDLRDYIRDFLNSETREEEHKRIINFLSILRELRNEVGAVVESVQPL